MFSKVIFVTIFFVKYYPICSIYGNLAQQSLWKYKLDKSILRRMTAK